MPGDERRCFRFRLILTEDKPSYPGYNEKAFGRLAKPGPEELLAAWAGPRAADLAMLRAGDLDRWGVHGGRTVPPARRQTRRP